MARQVLASLPAAEEGPGMVTSRLQKPLPSSTQPFLPRRQPACLCPSLQTLQERIRCSQVLTGRLQAFRFQGILTAGAALGRDKSSGSLQQWTLQTAGTAKLGPAVY